MNVITNQCFSFVVMGDYFIIFTFLLCRKEYTNGIETLDAHAQDLSKEVEQLEAELVALKGSNAPQLPKNWMHSYFIVTTLPLYSYTLTPFLF